MKKNLTHLFSFALCAALLLGPGSNLSFALDYEDAISDGVSMDGGTAVSSISTEISDTTDTADAGITYSYDTDTKTLVINGEGPMDDYPLNSSQQFNVYPAWWGCYAEAEKIIIGDGITYIGEHAFYELNHCCDAMKELVIGDSVEEIAQSAFVWTKALEKVTIGKSLKTVGSSNFGAGYDIAEVHISDLTAYCGINYGEYNASPFEASGIASLYLNDEKITDLVVPEGVTEIGDRAFAKCNLNSVTLPETMTKWGTAAFASNPVTAITIPNGLCKKVRIEAILLLLQAMGC